MAEYNPNEFNSTIIPLAEEEEAPPPPPPPKLDPIRLEAQCGHPDANSYATREQADSFYAGDVYFRNTWQLLQPEEREQWLIFAARSVDIFGPWVGERQFEEQPMEFPRVEKGVPLSQSKIIPNQIPKQIIEAQLQMLVYLYKQGQEEENFQTKLGVLNGLVQMEFKEKQKGRITKLVSQGELETVKALVRPYLGTGQISWSRG